MLRTIHRFEVTHRVESGEDPHAAPVLAEARAAFPTLEAVHARRVYLVDAPLDDEQRRRVADELLGDPVVQVVSSGAAESAGVVLEVHYQTGVMDPAAQSTQDALVEMFPALAEEQVEVRTGTRYDFTGAALDPAALRDWAARHIANPVVQDLYDAPFEPDAFPHGSPYVLRLTHVAIRDLDDDALLVLSRDGHLFLDLNEMRAVQAYYRDAGREPTDIELETLAQTWSEHCVHKTLKATVAYTGPVPPCPHGERPNHDPTDDGVTIHNLLKSTVAAATFKLKEDPRLNDWLVSVFDDNSGIVKFDETHGVCIKVETHNHPSAIEPYGGAATGIGGCIRDIIGTGLAAKPIANTNVFAVAYPDRWREEVAERPSGRAAEEEASMGDTRPLPSGVLHPRRTLQQVVAGVRDYGNRMGIPTVNGAVLFDDDYVANPLVFAGSVGLIPLDKCFGDAQPGDRIVALGGATGRDGIHGATFSSDELTDTHADEFAHAVQIGNPITEKQTLDVILRARDAEGGPLFTAITDCGAGGFSSAVGEMGEKVGADVTLDTAPLKYAGLSYTEVWISEAQERFVLAVPAENADALKAMCDAEDVPYCDLGAFGLHDDGVPTLRLTYQGTEVGRLSMRLLHDGVPMPTREARWSGQVAERPSDQVAEEVGARSHARSLAGSLRRLLAQPNIASKHWIVRQYDHEVLGGSVVKPLVGPAQQGPGDASVLRPKLDSDRAIALGCGAAPWLGEKATPRGFAVDGDSYQATLHALDEAVRNVVCVGGDPSHTAILDNFCWAKCTDPTQLGSLTRAAWACYDGALAFGTPFVSGKDSLSNQFTTEAGELITIPPTLLVTAMAMVDDAARCVTMDAKAAGNALVLVGATTRALGGSHAMQLGLVDAGVDRRVPAVDLTAGPKHARAVADAIAAGLVRSAHDCSDGGLLVAAAEMAFAGGVGLDLDLTDAAAGEVPMSLTEVCFAETASRYLLEVEPARLDALLKHCGAAGVPVCQVGAFASHGRLTARTRDVGGVLDEALDGLLAAWRGPLDW